jgi:hypothetical protein
MQTNKQNTHARAQKTRGYQTPKLVNIEAVVWPSKFPPRMATNHLNKDAFPTPHLLKLLLVLSLRTIPVETFVVNEPKPYLQNQFHPRPLNVVEDSVVSFHP